MGEQVDVQLTIQLLDIHQVIDVIDQTAVDAFIEVFMACIERVTFLRRQIVEVVDPLRRGHLQRQLGVLQRIKARGARHPVQLVAVAVDIRQQVVIDLCRALAAAQYGN